MLTERKAKLLVGKAFSLKSQIDKLNGEYNRARESVYDYMDQEKIKHLEGIESDEVGSEAGVLIATKVERVVNITYDIAKLKKKLDKGLFDEIVDRTYTVTNIDALIALLKKAGIKPKEFKPLIHVTETVNNAKLQQAYSVGEVTVADIADAYDARISKSLMIKRKASEKD